MTFICQKWLQWDGSDKFKTKQQSVNTPVLLAVSVNVCCSSASQWTENSQLLLHLRAPERRRKKENNEKKYIKFSVVDFPVCLSYSNQTKYQCYSKCKDVLSQQWVLFLNAAAVEILFFLLLLSKMMRIKIMGHSAVQNCAV